MVNKNFVCAELVFKYHYTERLIKLKIAIPHKVPNLSNIQSPGEIDLQDGQPVG